MVDVSKLKLRLTGKQPEKHAGSQSRLSPLENEKKEVPKEQVSPDLPSPVSPQSPGPLLADFSNEDKAEFGVDAAASKPMEQRKVASKVVKGKASKKTGRKPKPTMLQRAKAVGLVPKATKPFALFLKKTGNTISAGSTLAAGLFAGLVVVCGCWFSRGSVSLALLDRTGNDDMIVSV